MQPKKKIEVGKLLKDNLKIILLGLIVSIIFNEYLVRIILFVTLGNLGIWSLRITNYLPNLNLETISATAVLLAFRYDWKVGALFCVIFMTVGFVKNGKLNLISITVIALACLGGAIGQLIRSLGYNDFGWVFIATMFIKSILSIPIMQVVNPNLGKNVGHAILDGFVNIFLLVHVMTALNSLLDLFHLY